MRLKKFFYIYIYIIYLKRRELKLVFRVEIKQKKKKWLNLKAFLLYLRPITFRSQMFQLDFNLANWWILEWTLIEIQVVRLNLSVSEKLSYCSFFFFLSPETFLRRHFFYFGKLFSFNNHLALGLTSHEQFFQIFNFFFLFGSQVFPFKKILKKINIYFFFFSKELIVIVAQGNVKRKSEMIFFFFTAPSIL